MQHALEELLPVPEHRTVEEVANLVALSLWAGLLQTSMGCNTAIEQLTRDIIERDRWRPEWGAKAALTLVPTGGARSESPSAYITSKQLSLDAAALFGILPPVDLVVGISRSGLIPAALVATLGHYPLFAASESGVVDCGRGWRIKDQSAEARRIALVDDTAWRGGTMTKVLAKVAAEFPRAKILRAVVYATPQAVRFLDHYACLYGGMHYLEWNLFNSGHAENMATDLDGVICDDRTGRLLQAPRRNPVTIVTGRPEDDRAETENWLDQNEVKRTALIMGPWGVPPEEEQIGRWKADWYKKSSCTIFVESSPGQATTIREISRRSVLCPALGKVL